MNHGPSIREIAEHEWVRHRDLRLRALADSPDAFGSTLAREQAWTDSEYASFLKNMSTSPLEVALVAELEDEFVGLVWGRVDPAAPDTADVYSMWVAPDCRGLGVGRRLLDAVLSWAREAGARYAVLSVTCGVEPASELYASAGFQPVGAPEPLRPGSSTLCQPMRLDLR